MILSFDHKEFIHQYTEQSHTGVAAYLTILQTMTKHYQKKLPQEKIEDLPLHYDNVHLQIINHVQFVRWKKHTTPVQQNFRLWTISKNKKKTQQRGKRQVKNV